MKFLPTDSAIKGASYLDSAESFFGRFPSAFDMTRCQILKLETRQSYQEPDNESFVAMKNGDWDRSMSLLRKSRAADVCLYKSLSERGVDFIRCRPLKFPLSNYLRWELEIFKFNAEMCERIFCCNYDALDFVFTDYARHDFMTFDARLAFVHNYDASGLIQGGWIIEDADQIAELQKLFIFIKSHCQPFRSFLC